MQTFKRTLLALLLFPVVSFASSNLTIQDILYGNETTIRDVTDECYMAFKGVFMFLPTIVDKLNEKAGEELLEITNVKVPMLGNKGFISFDVTKTPQGNGLGHYKLYQEYASKNLYVRVDQMPMPGDNLDILWDILDRGMVACKENGLPNIPG